MKFSFSISKEPKAVHVPPVVMGSAIRSPRVMPWHAKALRESNERMRRMYESAITTNLNADFPASITSSNAEILTSVSASRARARKLERDNPYARAILEAFQDNVGGWDPFRLEMKVGKYDEQGTFEEEVETNRIIEQAWKEAALPENCTVRKDTSRLEMDLQAITAMIRDGGILWRHHRAFPNNEFGYAVEPIEIDRLDHYWNRPATGTSNEIQFSIEMDNYHAPVAYWILTRHPGDVFAYSSQPKYREQVVAKDVIALFDLRTRAGQYVGMPRFATIIQRLHRIDQFDLAHVTAAIWASCKPFFIVREFPSINGYVPDEIKQMMAQGFGESEDEAGAEQGEKMSNVEPGTGEELPFGAKPVLVDPKFPIEAADQFKRDHLRAAAAGAGVPYFYINSDLESVNFSSGRLGLQQFQANCKKLQEHFILGCRRPHFNEWLKYAILSGKVKGPKISIDRLQEFRNAANFHGVRWPYINPLQDVQADILRIEAGLDSRSRVIAESDRGGDVHTVNGEIASDRKCDEAHNLDFSGSDPTTPSVKKGEPGQELPAAEGEAPAPPAKTGGKQTIKKSRPNNGRLNQTLALLQATRNGEH